MGEEAKGIITLIVAIIVTICLPVFVDGFFHRFAIFVYTNWWLLNILVAVFLPLYIYLFFIGEAVLLPSETYYKTDFKILFIATAIIISLNIFCTLIIAGYGYYLDNRSGRPSLASLMGLFAIPYYIGVIPFVVAWMFGVLISVWFVGVGILAHIQSHPATQPVQRALSKRPDADVERDLAAVMRRQDVDDEMVWALYDELSLFKKMRWVTKLKVRGFKARQMRNTAEAHRDALHHEAELGRTVHEHERLKRHRAATDGSLRE